MALKIFTNLPSSAAAPAQNAQAPVVADQSTPANKECDNSPSFFMEDRNNDGITDKETHKYFMEMQSPSLDGNETMEMIEIINSMYDQDFNGVFDYETYMENGVLQSETKYNNQSGKKEEEKVYDSEGNLLYTRHYEYDENGNNVKTVEYNPDGTLDREINYKYDENGDYVGHVWLDDEGETHGYMKTFDENGNQTGEVWDYGDYGYTYETDENGNYIKDENGETVRIETGDISYPI